MDQTFGNGTQHVVATRFGGYDYAIFIIMFLLSLGIGFYWGFFKKQSAEEYLLGGRNMKAFPVAVSLIASYVSGISMIGTPTEIYVYGIQFVLTALPIGLQMYIIYEVYLPVFHDLNLTCANEYLEKRFDKKVRTFVSVLLSLTLVLWLPIVTYVSALAFNQVSGLHVYIVVALVCVLCIFYTCVGGLQAVVWTDTLQGIIMFVAVIVVVVKATIDVGGFSVVIERNLESGRLDAPDWDPNPLIRHTFWSLVFGSSVRFLGFNAVNQPMVQRYLALPDMKAVRNALIYYGIGLFCLTIVCCYCGLVMYAQYFDCDPITTKVAKVKDQMLPLLVMEVLGEYPGLPGIFIAGIFSATLSSLSTGLNSLAAMVLEDFYKPFFKKPLDDKSTQNLMKVSVVIYGLIVFAMVFLVENLGIIQQLNTSLSSITLGSTLGIFTMGMLIPRINAKGALIGGIVGSIVVGWICLNAELANARGDLKYEEKPTSVEGCQYPFDNSTTKNYDFSEKSDVFILYQLSYMWFSALGMIFSIIIGLVVSLLWSSTDTPKIDPKLLSPFLRKYYE